MKVHRATALACLLAAGLLLLPGTALAGPLLSGYGGPGAGEQALLGAGLIGPAAGGGGGGGESGGGGAVQSSAPGGSASSTGAVAAGGSTSRPSGSAGAGRRRHPAAASADREGRAPADLQVSAVPASATGPLGLAGSSGTAALLLLLGVVLVGALTVVLARGRRDGPTGG